MTNGEKMKKVFGLDRNVLETSNYSYIVPIDWWNAEYKEPTTENNLAVDCISRKRVLEWLENATDDSIEHAIDSNLEFIPSVTPQEPIEKCKWIKYDHRTMCPKEHIDVDSPYWRIPENRMETLKYCPYCGKEIEVEE